MHARQEFASPLPSPGSPSPAWSVEEVEVPRTWQGSDGGEPPGLTFLDGHLVQTHLPPHSFIVDSFTVSRGMAAYYSVQPFQQRIPKAPSLTSCRQLCLTSVRSPVSLPHSRERVYRDSMCMQQRVRGPVSTGVADTSAPSCRAGASKFGIPRTPPPRASGGLLRRSKGEDEKRCAADPPCKAQAQGRERDTPSKQRGGCRGAGS